MMAASGGGGNENPQVRRGADADLNQLRHDIERKSPIESSFLGENEEVLWEGKGKAAWSTDDNAENITHGNMMPGHVVVTTLRLLFVATGDDKTDHDGVVDAECIHLHAMSKDPVSVYVQIADTPSATNEVDTDPVELTLIPTRDGETQQESCQSLFDALSRLVSLHPIQLEEDDDDEDDDDMIFAAPLPENGGGATSDERLAMLDRLDNMLVVPPEFEVQDGQFDDADEDEEEDSLV